MDRAADSGGRSGSAKAAESVRLRDGLGYSVLVFFIVRVTLSLVAAVSVGVFHLPHLVTDSVPQLSPGWHNVVDGTDRWDAKRFERIAGSGYDEDDTSAAFFPGYPIAIRLVSTVPRVGDPDAALLVSNLAFLGGLVALYALTAREFSERRARKTVLLLAVFPTSFFFLSPYSESLFFLASVLTFWWARACRPWLAGASGFLAASVRSVGLLLVPALLIEAWRLPKPRRRAAIVASFLPLLAPLSFGFYWQVRAGDLLRPLHAQDSWHRTFEFPLVTLGHALWLGASGITSALGIYWTVDLVVTAAIVVPVALRWRIIPRSYLVYVLASLLVIFSYPLPARPLLSAPRFVLVLFPAFWAMADLWTGRRFLLAVSAFSIGWLVLSITFMNWGYIF